MVKSVFGLFGGMPNFLVFIAEVGIIVYLGYKCLRKNRKHAFNFPNLRSTSVNERAKIEKVHFEEVDLPVPKLVMSGRTRGGKRKLRAVSF